MIILPISMRKELKDPIGQLLKGEPSETVVMLKELLCRLSPPMFAVVGDFTAANIIEADIHTNIIIIDHRTMREEVDPMEHGERTVLNTVNPAGSITSDAWDILDHAVTLNSEVSVIVEGEEDLLVLPLIVMMPVGSVIVYGQPHEGMVAIKVTCKLKEWTQDFLTRMEESN